MRRGLMIQVPLGDGFALGVHQAAEGDLEQAAGDRAGLVAGGDVGG